ncbi:MAG: 1-acyl-sn-glycerol-3-phosphate acyltransferase [Bacteroidaceae bacterium]|nr:1-acyl-sn-glycerol-3-phosphate acyltransferase [Bacteroidaceae bacterium]
MRRKICQFLYYKVLGWKTEVTVPDYDKYVICCGPHTSNWDLFYGKLFYAAIGRKTQFMMKSEWFFWPLGVMFRAIGGIPVRRGKRNSLVEQMVQLCNESKIFHLAITPEGTRSANPNWKKGFYYIAQQADIPIVLIGIDYAKKTIYCNKVLTPSGDINKDMQEIKQHISQYKGKHPENFAI